MRQVLRQMTQSQVDVVRWITSDDSERMLVVA